MKAKEGKIKEENKYNISDGPYYILRFYRTVFI
jgi:hypothetical protein